jgi:hypothetical protein
VGADHGLGIGVEARDCEDATVHVEWCSRARAAIVFWPTHDECEAAEAPRFAGEEFGSACREHLIAMPFARAEFGPMVAPAGFELRCAADAFQFGDLFEEVSQPGDCHGEGVAPSGMIAVSSR